MTFWLLLFLAMNAAGVLVLIHYLRAAEVPISPRPHPSYIFRLVKRDERATYVRIMRRTTAVAMRDLGRSFNRLAVVIGKELSPVFERANAALSRFFE